jgi:hypothetical protein
MKKILALAFVAALAACQPAAPKPPEAPATAAPEAAPFTPGLELLIDENGATLHDWINADRPSFTMTCVLDSATISLSADRKQFATDAKSGPGALVVSGESFTDEAMIQEGDPGLVVLTVAMTPKSLKALAGATTARLSLGDSFAETGVDSGDTFEKFAAKCGELGKVKIAP